MNKKEIPDIPSRKNPMVFYQPGFGYIFRCIVNDAFNDFFEFMLTIVEYTDERKDAFKILNYEWLEKYFKVEPVDDLLLCNPQKEIIDKGGYIFFAEQNGEIVGTVALIPIGNNSFELGKMAVTEKYRNLGIGKKLMEHCLEFSKTNSIKKLILYSNRKLDSAIHVYRKYGFVEALVEPGHYERANIKMEKVIRDFRENF